MENESSSAMNRSGLALLSALLLVPAVAHAEEPVSEPVSHLTVNAPAGSKILVDGEPAVSGEPKAVDGGEHVVRVEAPCTLPNESRVNVGAGGDAVAVTIALGARSNEPACGGPPPTIDVVSPPEPKLSSWGTQKTVAVVLGGVSLVALGAGVGFGLSASSKKDEVASACGDDYPGGCPIDRRDELDATHADASRATAFSTLGIVAGVVFLGAAIGLYLTAPKTTRSASNFTWIAF